MAHVSIEELLEGLATEMRGHLQAGGRARLQGPRQWSEEIEAAAKTIPGIEYSAAESIDGEDLFVLWGQDILSTHWIPNLTEAELEIYQQLRLDGASIEQAAGSVKLLVQP